MNKENKELKKVIEKKNLMLAFMKKNKLVTFLIVVILALLISLYVQKFKINDLNKEHAVAVEQLQIANDEEISKVLSWAVRGELSRNNAEGINQIFLNFIRKSNVKKVMLLNTEKKIIQISTDKKDEGQNSPNIEYFNIQNQEKFEEDFGYSIATPVMGLDRAIGIVVVEFSK